MEVLGTILKVAFDGIVFYGAILGILFLLRVMAYWRLFTKAGRSGWLSIIPVVNIFVQYRISWSTSPLWIAVLSVIAQGFLEESAQTNKAAAAIIAVLGILIGLIHIIESFKLAKSYGKGFFFGLFLCIFPTLFMMILGLGQSVYVGSNGDASQK